MSETARRRRRRRRQSELSPTEGRRAETQTFYRLATGDANVISRFQKIKTGHSKFGPGGG